MALPVNKTEIDYAVFHKKKMSLFPHSYTLREMGKDSKILVFSKYDDDWTQILFFEVR